MEKLEIVYKDIGDIKPYKHNAKLHPDEHIAQIVKSIEDFGFNDPIAVDEDNIIIEGHGRLQAAKKLGMSTLPVIVLDGLTDQQKKAYILAHNQLTMNTGFDLEILQNELDSIDMFDMGDFGFENIIQQEKDPDEVKEDEAPEPPVVAKTKPGEIYRLGNHRLMCGDSTKLKDVERLMSGEKADLVLTDPPYNVAVGDKNKHLNVFDKAGCCVKNIVNDAGMTDEECGEKLWKPAFKNMRDAAKDCCSIYCFMPQGGAHMMMMMMASAFWQVKHELIWVKNNHVLGFADYDYKHEPILYGWNKSHSFYAENHQVSVFDDKLDIKKLKKEEMQELLQELLSEKFPTSVIYEDKPQKSDLHPTMKPIKLLARLVNNSSRPGELVLDLFGGSGSTLIACEQMNRRCYMMELDPHYVDVIIERWENLTGLKAEKIED